MDTGTGQIRPLEPDEELPTIKEALEAAELPPEVEVPVSYIPMTPEQRLVAAFGYRGGKDRSKQGRPGVATKADRRRRRKHRKASRQRNRR